MPRRPSIKDFGLSRALEFQGEGRGAGGVGYWQLFPISHHLLFQGHVSVVTEGLVQLVNALPIISRHCKPDHSSHSDDALASLARHPAPAPLEADMDPRRSQ